jgi:casein kinase I family protein HRR25
MIMELLGKSLEDLIDQYRTFSIKTVYILLIQMLEALAFIHDNDIVHRDIKPDNFVMGVKSKAYNLYVIDFGLSREYRDNESKQHYPMIKKKKLCGTARYASVHALECYEQSRRDDLESVSYVAVYLIKGELPWQGVKGKTKEERYAKILEMKRRMNEDDICSGIDGGDVKEFMKYVRGLGYEEEPEYKKWMNRFKEVLKRRFKWKEEYEYEWSRKDKKRKKKKKEKMMVLTMRTRDDKEESGNDYEDNDDKRKYNNVIQYKNNVNAKYVHSGNNDNRTYLSTYNNNNNITITNENNNNNNTDGSYKVDRDKTDNKCCIIY